MLIIIIILLLLYFVGGGSDSDSALTATLHCICICISIQQQYHLLRCIQPSISSLANLSLDILLLLFMASCGALGYDTVTHTHAHFLSLFLFKNFFSLSLCLVPFNFVSAAAAIRLTEKVQEMVLCLVGQNFLAQPSKFSLFLSF